MDENKKLTVEKTVKSGITFGSALAMVISYSTWRSVGWAIFHGLLSWVYVIYFILKYYYLFVRGGVIFGVKSPLTTVLLRKRIINYPERIRDGEWGQNNGLKSPVLTAAQTCKNPRSNTDLGFFCIDGPFRSPGGNV